MADPLPVEAFYQRDTFTDLKLSPDGRYLAAGVPLEDKTLLVIFERATMKVTGRLAFESQAHVEWFDWANDDYVVTTASKREGRLAQPVMLPGLYRLKVDGSDQGEIVSGSPRLLSLLRDDDEHILVQFRDDRGVAKVRVTNGAVRRQGVSLLTGTTRVSVDNAGEARLAVASRADERESRLYWSKARVGTGRCCRTPTRRVRTAPSSVFRVTTALPTCQPNRRLARTSSSKSISAQDSGRACWGTTTSVPAASSPPLSMVASTPSASMTGAAASTSCSPSTRKPKRW